MHTLRAFPNKVILLLVGVALCLFVMSGCGTKATMEGGTSDDIEVGEVDEAASSQGSASSDDLDSFLGEDGDKKEPVAEAEAQTADDDGEDGYVTEGPEEEGEGSTSKGIDFAEADESGASSAASAGATRNLVNAYTVKAGDTLEKIAARTDIYNESWLYPLIYQANKEKIADPAALKPGTRLTIPRGQSAAELDIAREQAMSRQFLTPTTVEAQTAALQADAAGAETEPTAPGQPVTPKKTSRTWLYALLGVLIAGGGVAFFLLKKKDNAGDDDGYHSDELS